MSARLLDVYAGNMARLMPSGKSAIYSAVRRASLQQQLAARSGMEAIDVKKLVRIRRGVAHLSGHCASVCAARAGWYGCACLLRAATLGESTYGAGGADAQVAVATRGAICAEHMMFVCLSVVACRRGGRYTKRCSACTLFDETTS